MSFIQRAPASDIGHVEADHGLESGTEYFDNTYIPQIVRTGMTTNLTAVFVSFIPALLTLFYFNLQPPVSAVIAATLVQLSATFAYYVVDPVAFFPILGVPGTYMAFMTGNISNLRLPCAANALKAAGVDQGTREASIISTIGVAASVVVNTSLLAFGVFAGTGMLAALPETITSSFSYLAPAIFGAVFVQLGFDRPLVALITLVLACVLMASYKLGLLGFFPGDPSYMVTIGTIAGSVMICKNLYKRGLLKE